MSAERQAVQAGRGPRWRRRLAAALVVVGVATPMLGAGAATPGQLPEWISVEDSNIPGHAPQSAYDEFAECPTPDEFPPIYPPVLDEDGQPVLDEDGLPVPDTSATPTGRHIPQWCVRLTAYNGEIKLGSTVAELDPIEITIGLTTGGVIVMGGDDTASAPSAVKIPGGLLGIPALDPIFDLSLGLLSVSATPQIGAAAPGSNPPAPPCEGDDCPNAPATVFGGWALGLLSHPEPVELSIPLSVRLNNTLFGPNCKIPEFSINLTTGTTNPPAGVEPMTGIKDGESATTLWQNPDMRPGLTNWFFSRVGTRFVDNAFAVPGPAQCDLVFGGLLNQPTGLFDSLIGNQVGLPSAAGQNYATFDIDVHTALYGYGFLYGVDANPKIQISPFIPPLPGLAFGDVPVGQSKTLTASFTNTGSRPMQQQEFRSPFLKTASTANQFEIVGNTCARPAVIAPGESCSIDVKFTPTSLGAKANGVAVPLGTGGPISADQARPDIAITARGVAAAPAPAAALTGTTGGSGDGSSSGTAVASVAPAPRCVNLLGLRLCV